MGIFSGDSEKIIERLLTENEKLTDIVKQLIPQRHHHHHLATHFLTTIFINGTKITANHMSVSILDTQSVTYKITPVLADGVTPSQIAPGSGVVTSSDTTLFTVTPDPTDPSGLSGTITGVAGAAGTGSLNVSGNSDVSGATQKTITGSDSVSVGLPTPPPSLAAGFTFSYGTPTP